MSPSAGEIILTGPKLLLHGACEIVPGCVGLGSLVIGSEKKLGSILLEPVLLSVFDVAATGVGPDFDALRFFKLL